MRTALLHIATIGLILAWPEAILADKRNRIVALVAAYNALADDKRDIPAVPNDFDYQAYMSSGRVAVRIAIGVDDTTYIDLEATEAASKELRVAWESFMRVADPTVGAQELGALYRKLKSGRYQYYDRLAFNTMKLGWNIGREQKAVIELR